MNTVTKYLFLLILLFITLPTWARDGIGNWWIYFGNNKISKQINWHNEIQYRNYNFAGNMEQLMLRTGFGYDLSPNNNNILLGYGHIISKSYDEYGQKFSMSEHRIFAQFITKQSFSRIYLQHRYRVEYRSFQQINDQFRTRYFLSANIPLNNQYMIDRTFYLSLYNEIFINLQKNYYDRNRAYAAFGYQINKGLKAELGYMTQILPTSSTHQFQVVFFNNLSYQKNQ